ncbi:MAG: AAA family ATPase, partial [Candidatus Edwardsbacteria bacterium]|nr:AAA family ATPase [Candidatus Edwardsbacteria bacterium]
VIHKTNSRIQVYVKLHIMFERTLKSEIAKYLPARDIVVIHGARQVGKTTLLQMIGETLPPAGQHYLDLEDSRLLAVCEGGPQATIDYLRHKGAYRGQKAVLFDDR